MFRCKVQIVRVLCIFGSVLGKVRVVICFSEQVFVDLTLFVLVVLIVVLIFVLIVVLVLFIVVQVIIFSIVFFVVRRNDVINTGIIGKKQTNQQRNLFEMEIENTTRRKPNKLC